MRCNIEEENKNLYSLFTNQCDSPIKTKLKRTTGCDKAHNTPDGIKLLDLIRSLAYDIRAHMQGKWERKKSDKCLYPFFHRRSTTKNDYMKEFDFDVNAIESYGGRTPMHPGLVKSMLTNTEV